MRLAVLLLAPALLAGCAMPAGGGGTSYAVTSQAEFYKYGPAQPFGADSTLKAGDQVTMLRREYGFSQVMLADGQSGYVSTDFLKALPPPAKAAAARPAARRIANHASSSSAGSNVRPVPEPLFDVNDVPSPPLPTNPEKPASSLR